MRVKMAAPNPKPVVYMSRAAPLEPLLDLFSVYEVRGWQQQGVTTKEEMMEDARGAHALFVYPPLRVDADVLDAVGPQLKVVGTMSVGVDHIDVAQCRSRGVEVGHTPAVLTTAVAEFTLGLLLATARRMREAVQAVHSGEWGTRWDDALWLAGMDLCGSTVGIVGLGRIGQAVATRLKAFEPARILYCGRSPKAGAEQIGAEYTSFRQLLMTSDVVLATCSVGEENYQLFNTEAFSVMKQSAIFINVSRGELVDQDALLHALTSGQISAAGLDVTSPEPLPADHPLLQLRNCTVLPHLATHTRHTRHEMCRVTVSNIVAGLEDQPLPWPAPQIE